MSLLQNEDFVLYQLRTGFLANNRDIYPERLINVNTTVLNDPAFRAAGWLPNAAEIRRTHSPPIPAVVTSEYFRAPFSAGRNASTEFGEDEEEGGMVTGAGSNDTVGPTRGTRRKRRRDQRDLEDDDSSDLSDESDEADEPHTAAQQLRFTKMPVRNRAGSSPPVQVMVTSPSRPPDDDPLRGGSRPTAGTMIGRPRRDTTTSSDLSSENEIDQSLFRKRTVRGRADASKIMSLRIQEDEREHDEQDGIDPDMGEDIAEDTESDESSLASDFSATADSTSILGEVGDVLTSPLGPPLRRIAGDTPRDNSPKKWKQPPAVLQDLPPPRPISIIQPSSLLSMALKSKDKLPQSPFERFATLSGKGEPNPLYIKLYIPHSPARMFELLVRRSSDVGGNAPVTVAEAIGLALYRYGEEKFEPPIDPAKMNVNWFNFRMVEDEEVEFDFPPITRTKALNDFTSNNNRPQRARARDKPWDEFALVEANEREFRDNERLTPEFSEEADATSKVGEVNASSSSVASKSQHPTPPIALAPRNPIMGPSFNMSARKDSSNLLDAPAGPVNQSVPRSGPQKAITVHFTDDNFLTRTTTIEVTTDTYIAEIFDQVCKKLNVDKALYVLKVSGSSTVAPTDRTIEALGDRTDLDLLRRRFAGPDAMSGLGLAGSAPTSGSPSAPLLVATGGTPGKSKKGKQVIIGPSYIHPLAQQNAAFTAANNLSKRYVVVRKQPMSFSSSSTRILSLEQEYLHIMPSQEGGGVGHNPGGKELLEAPGKTTTVHYGNIAGVKIRRNHPKTFSFSVMKEKVTKKYDFDAKSAQEATEIVREIKRGMARNEI